MADDNHIQQLLDDKDDESLKDLHGREDKEDLERYRQLYNALERDFPQGLPYNFSSTVRARLQYRLNRRKNFVFWVSLVAIVLCCMGAMAAYMFFIDRKYNAGFMTVLAKYKWIVVFSLMCLFLIQYFDHRFVKSKRP